MVFCLKVQVLGILPLTTKSAYWCNVPLFDMQTPFNKSKHFLPKVKAASQLCIQKFIYCVLFS